MDLSVLPSGIQFHSVQIPSRRVLDVEPDTGQSVDGQSLNSDVTLGQGGRGWITMWPCGIPYPLQHREAREPDIGRVLAPAHQF